MPIARLIRQTATVAALSGLAVAGLAAAPASASATPGWRVTRTFGPADGVWSENFTVTSASDAWSTWIACAQCAGSKPVIKFYVDRFNGRGWHGVPLPASMARYVNSVVSLGASSASDAWLFNGAQYSRDVLRWNGRRWYVQHVPQWVIRLNLSGTYDIVPEVFGPKSAWVFSLGVDSFTSPEHDAARYTGGRWVKVTLPGVPSFVSAVSASDIWVIGSTPGTALKARPKYILMHWNGKRWSTLNLPAIRLSKGQIQIVGSLAAAGPRDVWLMQGRSLPGGPERLFLHHWNGRAWRNEPLPARTTSLGSLVPEADGTVWALGNGLGPAFRWKLYHFRNGRWTSQFAPGARNRPLLDMLGIFGIPGSGSVWGAANLSTPGNDTGGIYGAILKYGR